MSEVTKDWIYVSFDDEFLFSVSAYGVMTYGEGFTKEKAALAFECCLERVTGPLSGTHEHLTWCDLTENSMLAIDAHYPVVHISLARRTSLAGMQSSTPNALKLLKMP